jgi:glycine oxidase
LTGRPFAAFDRTMSARPQTVLVLGAGVFGLSAAAALAAEGCDVVVLDPEPEAGGASAIAAGMLSPGFELALASGSTPPEHAQVHRAAWEAWPAFARRFGLTLKRDGALWAGPAGDLRERFAAAGFPLEVVPDGLFAPQEGRVEPRPALARLRAAVTAAGGRIVAGRASSVHGLGTGGAVNTPDGPIEADRIVVACGWSAAKLEGSLGPAPASVRPIKGQIAVLKPLRAAPDRVVRGPGVYVVPREDGTVAVGATMEPGVANRRVDPDVVARLRDAAADLVPELAGAEIVRGEAGVRGASPDGLPLVGTVAAGVDVALAPRRNGWLLAPLVAGAVLASAKGERPPFASALDPLRFSRE